MNLYRIQDSDRPCYVLAPSYQAAVHAFRVQMMGENPSTPACEVEDPDGVELLARRSNPDDSPEILFLPGWRLRQGPVPDATYRAECRHDFGGEVEAHAETKPRPEPYATAEPGPIFATVRLHGGPLGLRVESTPGVASSEDEHAPEPTTADNLPARVADAVRCVGEGRGPCAMVAAVNVLPDLAADWRRLRDELEEWRRFSIVHIPSARQKTASPSEASRWIADWVRKIDALTDQKREDAARIRELEEAVRTLRAAIEGSPDQPTPPSMLGTLAGCFNPPYSEKILDRVRELRAALKATEGLEASDD